MKRLKVFLVLATALLLVGSVDLSAQGRFGKDSADCVSNLNFYRDFYRSNNMAEASTYWLKAFQFCPPTASQNLFIHGKKIVNYLILNSSSDEEKAKLINTLLDLHETRAQYYPKYALTAKEDKIIDLMRFYDQDPSKAKIIYDYVNSYVNEYGVNSNPIYIVNGMIKAGEAFNNNDIPADEVMNAYALFNGILEQRKALGNYETIDEKMEMLQNAFIQSGVANCANLVKVFTPRFEAAQNDTATLKVIANLLNSNDCTNEELFSKVVARMYALNPSSSSAYFLYRFYGEKGDEETAFKYLEEAARTATGVDKGTYLYEVATTLYKKRAFGPAAMYARQASELNPKYAGKAYMLIGNIWAGAGCGGNEINKRAKFWVATDYMMKAKAADPSLADEADKNIGRYRSYFPTAADAFMYDLTDGKGYTVSCGGMTASTTVRTNK